MKRLYGQGALLLVVLCLALLQVACGPGNAVRLIYAPSGDTVFPQPNAPRVAVVMFEDARTQQQLGERRDGTVITPSSAVPDWVSRSLGDELARLGLQVSYATTLNQARGANPEFIVTGVVREVWLKEVGPTTMSATVRVSVTLTGRKGKLYEENFSSSQERKGLLTPTLAENLLSDTVRDVLTPAALKIQAQMQR